MDYPVSLSEVVKDVLKNQRKVPYWEWFTDRMSQDYVSSLPLKYAQAKSEATRSYAFAEAQGTLTNYSLIVYYIYPSNSGLQKEIAATPELAKNFALVKDWLDKNEGKKVADEFLELFAEAGSNQR